jgi:hypothetical protein
MAGNMTLKNTFLLSSGFSMSFKHFNFRYIVICFTFIQPDSSLSEASEKQYLQGYLMEVGLVQQSALMEMKVKVNSDVQKCKFDGQTHIQKYLPHCDDQKQEV